MKLKPQYSYWTFKITGFFFSPYKKNETRAHTSAKKETLLSDSAKSSGFGVVTFYDTIDSDVEVIEVKKEKKSKHNLNHLLII